MRNAIRIILVSAFLTVLVCVAGCTKSDSKKTEFWIYTSLYKDTISDMLKPLEKEFPDVKFNFYQSGSENVAARMTAEFAAGGTQADLVMTSDPFWYLELKKEGKFLPYKSPAAEKLDEKFKDPDGAFAIVRVPVVVMAYNTQEYTAETAPKSFDDLLQERFKGKVSMGSPLQSGTAFTAVGQLVRNKGWQYFETLRKHDLTSAGGNSAVISRIETKERPIGIVLLENVIEAKRRGSPIEPIYPTDGVILSPSPIAILASSKHPELAKRVYDFFYSDTMQTENIRSRMYSVFPHIPAPEGTKAFADVRASSMEWSGPVMHEIFATREATKEKFMTVVLN